MRPAGDQVAVRSFHGSSACAIPLIDSEKIMNMPVSEVTHMASMLGVQDTGMDIEDMRIAVIACLLLEQETGASAPGSAPLNPIQEEEEHEVD